jgi:hypothetical protein
MNEFLQKKDSTIEHGTKEMARGESVIALFYLLVHWTLAF